VPTEVNIIVVVSLQQGLLPFEPLGLRDVRACSFVGGKGEYIGYGLMSTFFDNDIGKEGQFFVPQVFVVASLFLLLFGSHCLTDGDSKLGTFLASLIFSSVPNNVALILELISIDVW